MIYREKVDRWIVEPEGKRLYQVIRIAIAIILFPIVILPIVIEYVAPLCEKFDNYISYHVRGWSAWLLNKVSRNYCHKEGKQ